MLADFRIAMCRIAMDKDIGRIKVFIRAYQEIPVSTHGNRSLQVSLVTGTFPSF